MLSQQDTRDLIKSLHQYRVAGTNEMVPNHTQSIANSPSMFPSMKEYIVRDLIIPMGNRVSLPYICVPQTLVNSIKLSQSLPPGTDLSNVPALRFHIQVLSGTPPVVLAGMNAAAEAFFGWTTAMMQNELEKDIEIRKVDKTPCINFFLRYVCVSLLSCASSNIVMSRFFHPLCVPEVLAAVLQVSHGSTFYHRIVM